MYLLDFPKYLLGNMLSAVMNNPCLKLSCFSLTLSLSPPPLGLVYEAGKAIKSGVPSHYAPTLYAPSMYAQPIHGLGGGSPAIPMLPMPPMHPGTNYRDYDHASSGMSKSMCFHMIFSQMICQSK